MQRCIRLIQGLLVAVLLITLSPQKARAGELAKPIRLWALAQIYYGSPTTLYFALKNKNASFALGVVRWTIIVRLLQTQSILYQMTGEVNVGKSDSVVVDPGAWTPTQTGAVEVKVTANSDVNISGEQVLTVQEEVLPAPECPRPSVTPGSVLNLTNGNTITYTAPANCCFRITPFVNSGVWYTMSPTGTQTISNGSSVTFTLTPKDSKPMASVVGFAWVECEKGTPKGHDYIVVSPKYPTNSGDSTEVPGIPGVSLYRWFSLFGDPVAPASGAFVHSDGDDIAFRAGPVRFARSYNSRALDAGLLPTMGLNWSHTYDARVIVQGNDAILDLPYGSRTWFVKNGAAWSPRVAGSNTVDLQRVAAGFVATDITRGMQYTFNIGGALTKIDDGFVPVHVAWKGNALDSVTDMMGHTIKFTADGIGRVASASNGTRTWTYMYAVDGELANATATGGDDITYAYTAPGIGRLSAIDRGGITNTIRNTYDARGNVVSQVDAVGNRWTYSYGKGTATVTDGEGAKQTHTFLPSGEVTTIGSEAGAISFKYDANGRPITLISAEGDSTKITWHTSGQVASRRSADGSTTSYAYAARTWNGATVYDLVTTTHPDGTKTEYKRDARGHVTEVKGPTGAVTTYTRNTVTGYITSEKDPLDRVTQYAYDASGHATSTTSPLGAQTLVTTNASGDILGMTLPGARTVAFTYDTQGRVLTEKDENGHIYTYTRDQRGNVTQLKHPSTNTESWTYDDLGAVTGYTVGTRTYSLDYDAAGRLESIHDPSNAAMMFVYDGAGNITQTTDRAGTTTRYGYDMDGHMTSSTTPLGHKTLIQRDMLGRVVSVTSPLGSTTTSTYNINGDIASTTYADGRAAQYTYDARGLLTRLALPLDIATNYSYDASGSITKVIDPMGGEWRWGYDAGGRVATVTNPMNAVTTYKYDAADRVTQLDMPGNRHVNLTYDAAGNVLTMSNTEGASYTYTYDSDGRITGGYNVLRTYDATGAMISSIGLTMTRNANGRIATITYAPGKVVTYAYDANDRVTSITDWTNAVITFTRDIDGHVTGINRPNGIHTTYAFDNDGHMTSIVEGALASTVITRDAAGRVARAQRTGHLEPTLSMTDSTYTYDAANTALQPHNYEVGLLGKDAFGRVVGQVRNGVIRNYTRNDAIGEGVIAKIANATSDQTFVIMTPEGMVVSVIDAVTSAHSYPHYSESGNTILVTNDAGTASARYAYSAYGEVLASEGAPYPFLFGGIVGILPLGDGAYAMGPRIYDSKRGRFATEDPVMSLHPVSMNAYQYANEDPVNYEDWSGRSPQPQPSAADEIMRASNERLDAANKATKDEYDARMRELEQRSAQRAAEREARAKAERDARERLEREQQAERDRDRADRDAFDKAQKKAEDVNDILLGPPPVAPTQPRPVQPPPETPTAPTPTPTPAPTPWTGGGNGGPKPKPKPGGSTGPAPAPAPVPAPGTGRRSGGTGRGEYIGKWWRDVLEYIWHFD